VIVNVDLDWQDFCPVLINCLLRQIHSLKLFGVDWLVRHVHRFGFRVRKDHIVSDVELLGLLLHELSSIEGLAFQLQASMIVLIRALELFEIHFMLTDHIFRSLNVLQARVWFVQMPRARVAEVMSEVKLAYLLVVVLKGEAG